MNSRFWPFLLIGAFVLGLSVKIFLVLSNDDATTKTDQFTATELKSTELFGFEGKAVKLFDENDTRMRVLYFGFTRCPDVCPTSLAMLGSALTSISSEQLAQLRPIFVSLDPERDEPNASHQYAQYFHHNIEGLSAPLAVTKPLADHYGVIFRKSELAGSDFGYTLDHSSYFYFLAADGTLVERVPHTVSPEPLVDAINRLLNAQTTAVHLQGNT